MINESFSYAHREGMSSSEFPVPANKDLLIDVDLTLINTNLQLMDDRIYEEIEKTQNQGWTLGLSSDSSHPRLRYWKQKLGLNGGLIAERGAIVETAEGNVMVDQTDIAVVNASRSAITEYLTQVGGLHILGRDSIEMSDEPIRVGQSGDAVIIINRGRQCGLSISIKRVHQNGELIIDNNLTEEIVGSIRHLFPPFEDIYEDMNHDYGVLIVTRHGTKKSLGTQILMEQERLTQVAMVGNAMTDYVGPDIALHYAVANADQDFKDKAVYTAQAPMTSGVIEILTKLRSSKV